MIMFGHVQSMFSKHLKTIHRHEKEELVISTLQIAVLLTRTQMSVNHGHRFFLTEERHVEGDKDSKQQLA